jgi:hypothetical protein
MSIDCPGMLSVTISGKSKKAKPQARPLQEFRREVHFRCLHFRSASADLLLLELERFAMRLLVVPLDFKFSLGEHPAGRTNI